VTDLLIIVAGFAVLFGSRLLLQLVPLEWGDFGQEDTQ
jgi:hypothetical protein